MANFVKSSVNSYIHDPVNVDLIESISMDCKAVDVPKNKYDYQITFYFNKNQVVWNYHENEKLRNEDFYRILLSNLAPHQQVNQDDIINLDDDTKNSFI